MSTAKIVEVPSIKRVIAKSPGFAKKELSTYKLDLLALCGFGCLYCSSNNGNYLRVNREKFADLAEDQLGERVTPGSDPSLMMVWPDVLEKLALQIKQRGPTFGEGHTLVFSMLTDGFSPKLVTDGITEAALTMLMEGTSFRVRVLTKNAIVGSKKWIAFFQRWPGRFVVGLSMGTRNKDWAKAVEIGTSLPQARLRATQKLQAAGVPTYGMLCPVFPDAMGEDLDTLITALNPDACEHIWAEPYNDRSNWKSVQAGYKPGTEGFEWFDRVYGAGRMDLWSNYATDLFVRLKERAIREGWLHKLRYLLYETDITVTDASEFGDLTSVLLQSATKDNGTSQNTVICGIQSA